MMSGPNSARDTHFKDSEVAVHLYEEYGMSLFNYLQGKFATCI